MRTIIFAACALIFATAPALAAGDSNTTDSSDGSMSNASGQQANPAQQSGGMKDKMKKKAGEQGKQQIDKHAGTGQQGGNNSAANGSSGGMKDTMKKKAGEHGKRKIDEHAGTGPKANTNTGSGQ